MFIITLPPPTPFMESTFSELHFVCMLWYRHCLGPDPAVGVHSSHQCFPAGPFPWVPSFGQGGAGVSEKGFPPTWSWMSIRWPLPLFFLFLHPVLNPPPSLLAAQTSKLKGFWYQSQLEGVRMSIMCMGFPQAGSSQQLLPDHTGHELFKLNIQLKFRWLQSLVFNCREKKNGCCINY